MDNKEKEFYLHKHYGVTPKANITPKPKIVKNSIKHKLIYIATKETIKQGNYGLCQSRLNEIPSNKKHLYKIVKDI
jgi:hypothetical protein